MTTKRDVFDFGFSFASEDELKAYEKELEKQLEATAQDATLTVEAYKEKLNGLRAMIMILLRNLLQEPEKHYIWWPQRQEKVQEFIARVNAYVDGP